MVMRLDPCVHAASYRCPVSFRLICAGGAGGSEKLTGDSVRGGDRTEGGKKPARRELLLKRFSFMCRASSTKACRWHRVKNAAQRGKCCNGRREGNLDGVCPARKDTSLAVLLNRQA